MNESGDDFQNIEQPDSTETNQNGHHVKTGTAMQGHASWIKAMCESK